MSKVSFESAGAERQCDPKAGLGSRSVPRQGHRTRICGRDEKHQKSRSAVLAAQLGKQACGLALTFTLNTSF